MKFQKYATNDTIKSHRKAGLHPLSLSLSLLLSLSLSLSRNSLQGDLKKVIKF